MKNNVIKFPAPDHLRWAEFSKSMSDGLIQGGCSDDEIEYVVSRIKPVFLANPSEISVEAANMEDLTKEVLRQIQQLFNALMLELVKRELELCRLRGDQGSNR